MLQVTSISEQVGPAVVHVGRGRRRGSGFVVARDRVTVLTRSLGGDTVRVGIGGEELDGSVIAADLRAGLSLLGVPTGEISVPSWSADAPKLGDAVFALGDPGTGLRVTEGRVSAAALQIRSHTGRSLAAIEHTAPLSRGSGGGPLLDSTGAVVGINVLRGDPGFILGLAGSVAQQAIERMLSGTPQPARLGVAVAPPRVAMRLRAAVGLPEREGVLVRDVESGSAAARAGVRAGDLLVALGDVELDGIGRLHDALELASSATTTTLDVVRGVDQLRLELTLSEAAR